MTTVELQAKKAALIQEILNNLNTEAAIYSLEQYIHKLITSDVPTLCCYTHEEKLNRIDEAETAFENGLFTSHADVKNRLNQLKQSWNH